MNNLKSLFVNKDLELIVTSGRNPDHSEYHNPLKEAIMHIEHRHRELRNKKTHYGFKPCKICGHCRHEHALYNSKGTLWEQIKCTLTMGYGYCEENCECKHYKKISYDEWLLMADQYMQSYGFQSRTSQRNGFNWTL